mgnify:CR=1 FL=1
MSKLFLIDTIKYNDRDSQAKTAAIYKKYPDCYCVDYDTDPVAGRSEYYESLSDVDDIKQMLAEYDGRFFSMAVTPTKITYNEKFRTFRHEHCEDEEC